MSCTEKEAAEKWCPFARVEVVWNHTSEVCGTRNRQCDGGKPDDLLGTKCIGSRCMAWRSDGTRMAAIDSWDGRRTEDVGYCGLAGKP